MMRTWLIRLMAGLLCAVFLLLNWPAPVPRGLRDIPIVRPQHSVDAAHRPQIAAVRFPPTPTPLVATPIPQTAAPLQLAYFYKPPQDGTTPEEVAARATLLILTKKDEGYRDQLRAAGYRGPVLQYILAAEVNGPPEVLKADSTCDASYEPWANNVAYQTGDFCANVHPHEDWFLHNGAGERLYYLQGTRWFYLMNPLSAGWRSFVQERSRGFLEGNAQEAALGYDGLFLDNVGLSIYKLQNQLQNSDGTVREFADSATYRSAWLGYLSELSAAFRPRWPIWANLIDSQGAETPWDPYLVFLDGMMHESFATSWATSAPQPPAYLEQTLQQVDRALAMGKQVLAVSQGVDAQREPFALASFLLVTREQQGYFRYAIRSDYEDWLYYDNYRLALGAPRGARYQLTDGTWRRDFTNGYVVVDPVAQTGNIVINTASEP